ncbi:MAG: hypothetical protein R3B09_32390 [Nannocystaceae bacterium]
MLNDLIFTEYPPTYDAELIGASVAATVERGTRFHGMRGVAITPRALAEALRRVRKARFTLALYVPGWGIDGLPITVDQLPDVGRDGDGLRVTVDPADGKRPARVVVHRDVVELDRNLAATLRGLVAVDPMGELTIKEIDRDTLISLHEDLRASRSSVTWAPPPFVCKVRDFRRSRGCWRYLSGPVRGQVFRTHAEAVLAASDPVADAHRHELGRRLGLDVAEVLTGGGLLVRGITRRWHPRSPALEAIGGVAWDINTGETLIGGSPGPTWATVLELERGVKALEGGAA